MSKKLNFILGGLTLLPLFHATLITKISIVTGTALIISNSDSVNANQKSLQKWKFYIDRGNKKFNNGDYKAAIEEYTKAIKIRRVEAAPYNLRGAAKAKLGDHVGAIADYTLAISFYSDLSEDPYLNRAYSKEKLKDFKGAIADYTKAIEINPKYWLAYFNRGYLKDELKDFKGAIADYTKAIEFNPEDSMPYTNRGISKEKLRDMNGACSDWKNAANLGDSKAAMWVKDDCEKFE